MAIKKTTSRKPRARNLRRVIVRTYSAGVFAGEFVSRNGQEVVLKNARRIWCWAGATTLSQLAQSGTVDPKGCKIAEPVTRLELMDAIEILDVTVRAWKIIDGIAEWKK